MSFERLPDAIDLGHHLSALSRARATSPLKGLQRYYGKEGIISLAGGLPHPDYFPFASINAEALVPDFFSLDLPSGPKSSLSWLWNLFSANKEKIVPLTIPKYPTKPNELNLAAALQYGMASGIPQLQAVVKEFTAKVYKPAYANYTTLVHLGNTDGWSKAAMTLCNPGEGILASEWTYPSAMALIRPHGVRPVPVPMDGQGMRSDALRKMLSEWDENARGMPRPHVMYTVPVGQNPTGATMEIARKKEIYDICVEFDVIIVEDDPYYFLQQGPYLPPSQRINDCSSVSGQGNDEEEEFISQLAPSYLRIDYQGRVVRLDSFSKTIAPGCRMGWFTCNPVFAERLERQGETTTQGPCGFGQSLVTSLMLQWHYEGYIRWLKGLRIQYRERRNFFIDCLGEEFHLERTASTSGIWEGCDVYFASQKPKTSAFAMMSEKRAITGSPMFSFVPPTSGMYVWLKLHFDHHPSFTRVGYEALEMKLWIALAEAGVLFGPGAMFAANPPSDVETPVGAGHFRISFSNAELANIKKAISIFATVLKEFFADV